MQIPYREKDHGSFDEEWLPHHGASDWWYVTGYLQDTQLQENFYSYQFTVFNPRYFNKTIYVLHLAFTDMQTGKHSFKLGVRLGGRKTGIDRAAVRFLPYGQLQKNRDAMILTAETRELQLDLVLNLGKGAFWQGDKGVLVMGLPDDPGQRTVYYSYTNMPTSGCIKLKNSTGKQQVLDVTGKSWFDRQWGPFRLFDNISYWEWFSIRFFDDEEVMLFAFPQHRYYDGNYIDKCGKTSRLFDYKYSCHTLKKNGKLLFSHGWDINLPGIKEEKYRLLPMNDGQYNGGYYETMCRVTKMDGTEVGFCFVEILPGVRQEGKKLNAFSLVLAQLHN